MTHTTQIQALRDLAKKIEVGENPIDCDFLTVAFPWTGHEVHPWRLANKIITTGSLDAAKSLHEATLGDRWGSDLSLWRADLSLGSFVSTVVLRWRQIGTEIYKLDKDPAIAWLLAIIEARVIELEIGE